MCDPSNPISGGACPVKNTGPPPVTMSLIDAIKTPAQLRSRTEGSWGAIGDNVKAIDYYIKTLGTGPQYQGYGKRVVYDTGIKCSNMPGNAHRLADGTAAGTGGYGLVPRMLGGIGGFLPKDLVDSAKDEVPCSKRRLHYNTNNELEALKTRGTDGIPSSNRIKISSTGDVNYNLVDQLCRQGKLRPCVEKPVANQDLSEGFTVRRVYTSSGGRDGSVSSNFERMMYLLGIIGILGGIGLVLIKRIHK